MPSLLGYFTPKFSQIFTTPPIAFPMGQKVQALQSVSTSVDRLWRLIHVPHTTPEAAARSALPIEE